MKVKNFITKMLRHYSKAKTYNSLVHFQTKKAAIVERFNRTLKSRMWKYFAEYETRKWIDVVQNIVNGYNDTYHTTIKMTPSEPVSLKIQIQFGGTFTELI